MSATPFVTVGSTPECDACHSYYAERHCEDCSQNLCTWCNLDRHEPIGKRNHWRPRLYGTDPHAHLERNATASADEALKQASGEWKLHSARSENQRDEEGKEVQNKVRSAMRYSEQRNGDARGRSREMRGASIVSLMLPVPCSLACCAQYTFDPTTLRVNVTTDHYLPLSAEECWDLLGDWDAPWLPWEVDVSSDGSRRTIAVPPQEDSAESEATLVTERLIQRNDREMFYSYARVDSKAETEAAEAAASSGSGSGGGGAGYTDLLSKFSFLPMPNGAQGEKRCVLQWTTSVLPNDAANPKRAAEAVAKFQESFKPFFDAAIQMED